MTLEVYAELMAIDLMSISSMAAGIPQKSAHVFASLLQTNAWTTVILRTKCTRVKIHPRAEIASEPTYLWLEYQSCPSKWQSHYP
jgi:hypothetical protein